MYIYKLVPGYLNVDSNNQFADQLSKKQQRKPKQAPRNVLIVKIELY